jgi:TonB family protein
VERLLTGRVEAHDLSTHNSRVMPQFTLLEISGEERRHRRACFGAGSLVGLLALMVFVRLLAAPQVLREREGPNLFWMQRITLPAPSPVSLLPKRMVKPSRPPSPVRTAELPKVEPKLHPLTAPVSTKLQTSPVPRTPPAVPPKVEAFEHIVPKSQLQTRVGTFGNRSAVPTLKLPRSSVQTGGFGTPNGLPGHAEGGSEGNVPRLGAFDEPEGPGSGNGTGGQRGARGLVASAGFGNGIAGAGLRGGRAGTGSRSVQSAGFADAQAQAHASPLPKPQATVVPYEPVQITEKPDPVYTTEARQLRIQGEVLLRVVFTATGRVQLLSIERGLGHGLDEAATRAAEQIQFKPARRDGQPVDTTASVHILFQLAN